MKKWKKQKIGESMYFNFERKNDSLRDIILASILKYGPSSMAKISDIVKLNWDPPFANFNLLAIREMINLVLSSDPLFDEDVGNPLLWVISKKHKKNLQKFAENITLKNPDKDDFLSSMDEIYLCKCGVKLEGNADTWKKGIKKLK